MPVEERVICKRIPSLYQRNKQEDHHQRLRVKALSEIKGTNTTLSAFLFFFFSSWPSHWPSQHQEFFDAADNTFKTTPETHPFLIQGFTELNDWDFSYLENFFVVVKGSFPTKNYIWILGEIKCLLPPPHTVKGLSLQPSSPQGWCWASRRHCWNGHAWTSSLGLKKVAFENAMPYVPMWSSLSKVWSVIWCPRWTYPQEVKALCKQPFVSSNS